MYEKTIIFVIIKLQSYYKKPTLIFNKLHSFRNFIEQNHEIRE